MIFSSSFIGASDLPVFARTILYTGMEDYFCMISVHSNLVLACVCACVRACVRVLANRRATTADQPTDWRRSYVPSYIRFVATKNAFASSSLSYSSLTNVVKRFLPDMFRPYGAIVTGRLALPYFWNFASFRIWDWHGKVVKSKIRNHRLKRTSVRAWKMLLPDVDFLSCRIGNLSWQSATFVFRKWNSAVANELFEKTFRRSSGNGSAKLQK